MANKHIRKSSITLLFKQLKIKIIYIIFFFKVKIKNIIIPSLLLMHSVWYFLSSALEKFINFDPINKYMTRGLFSGYNLTMWICIYVLTYIYSVTYNKENGT